MKKVEREAKQGEWIEITADKSDDDRYEVGDVFKAEKRVYYGVFVNTAGEHNVFLCDYEYVVLQGYHPRRISTVAAITIAAMILTAIVGMMYIWLSGAPL